jgi:hypothetical protein
MRNRKAYQGNSRAAKFSGGKPGAVGRFYNQAAADQTDATGH